MAVFNNKKTKNMMKLLSGFAKGGVFAFVFFALAATAHAAGVDDVSRNIVNESKQLPGLITAFSYLLALVLGVTGVLKLKEHVENPSQNPLRTPLIRFFIGGALLALPIIYEAMRQSIDGGNQITFGPDATLGASVSSGLGWLSKISLADNVNKVLDSIITSVDGLPGFISALTYLLGLLAGVTGLLKIKDHVESPDQNPLREGVVRLIVGGALFAIPTVYQAMSASIGGGGGVFSAITSLFGAAGQLESGYVEGAKAWACTPTNFIKNFLGPFGGLLGIGGGGPQATVGDSLCNIVFGAGAFPAFLHAISYLFGLVMGLWGILKLRDHVLNPSQTQVWEGFSRLIAGGLFFTLPFITEVARATLTPFTGGVLSGLGLFGFGGLITSYNEDITKCSGLDCSVISFVSDILGPTHILLNFFAITAGTVFLMIGISRLTKSAQEGARGPGGIGTIMTFIVGGMLISYNEIMKAFSGTMFLDSKIKTKAELSYAAGAMSTAEAQHAHTVITAILKFMIIIGLISFVRGIFIVRGVAEGNQQASLMAGVTHMVGGALAVNLGPLINAITYSLKISGYGIMFS